MSRVNILKRGLDAVRQWWEVSVAHVRRWWEVSAEHVRRTSVVGGKHGTCTAVVGGKRSTSLKETSWEVGADGRLVLMGGWC